MFNSTITEARNTYFEATGKDLDQEYEKLFQKYGPRRVRAEMNWHIFSVAVIKEAIKPMTDPVSPVALREDKGHQIVISMELF